MAARGVGSRLAGVGVGVGIGERLMEMVVVGVGRGHFGNFAGVGNGRVGDV